jgi:phosphatidylglycerol:prolipoprotein diacylglycerol transferase
LRSSGGDRLFQEARVIPTLFEIGPFRVHVYGVMLALSFFAGTWWALRSGRRRGIPEDRIFSLVGWILVSSILGSRLHYMLGHPESFRSPLDFLKIWEGGLTLYGGLIAAIVVSFLYTRRHGLGFLSVADVTAPALALGEGLTRIGCFLNGCCFGRPCAGPFCIHYPENSYAAQALGVTGVYPSQLLLSAGMGLLFLILWKSDRLDRPAGWLFSIYLVGQGLLRYGVDFTRYYEPVDRVMGAGPWLETKSQAVALALTVAGLALLWARRPAAHPVQVPGGKG